MQVRTRSGAYERRGVGENPLAPWGSTAPPPNSLAGGISTAGVNISERTALQLASAYGSVSLIADSIAALPLQQFVQISPDEATRIDLSPVIELPYQPWATFTWRDYVAQGTASMLLQGNLFGKIVARGEDLLPTQVKLIHPDHANVRKNAKGQIETRYYNQLQNEDNVSRAMGLSVAEGLVGISPIEALRNVMGLARAQDLYAGAFFANSARVDGVIKVKTDLNDSETKRMKDSWLGAHQGINHAHLPAVLTGDAEFQPISMPLADAQFLEQMQFSASVISGMIYRVPPHMLGMVDKDTSWGSGIEQQELGFVRNTLLIWLCRWEDLMRTWLPRGQFVVFDLSQRLRGDTLQRWTAYQMARVMGAMNNNEVRKTEGMPPIADPSGDAYDQPLNSAPMKPAIPGPVADGAN